MESTVKNLTITGGAAQDAMKPRRSTSRKKQQDGGDDEIPASEFSRVLPRILPRPPVQLQTKPQQLLQKPVEQPAQQPVQQPLQIQEAGSVILRPPKVQRVKLQPKIQMKPQGLHAPVAHTRKARKIHMVNLNQRFTRAKKVHAESGAKPMDAIRDFLVGKGVIQMKSKAPEKMLRSMYSDFMLLKDQAL
jgi:hypothetical protein